MPTKLEPVINYFNNDRKTILLVDGYHLLHKGYYGSLKRGKAAVNRLDQLINAVYTFVAKIWKYFLSKKYHTIIVAFDVSDECWRSKIYPNYKAKRKDTPEDLIPQMQIIREFLTEANIPWYELKGYEGDDVLGTIAKIAVKLNYNVEILSNDKDCYQLVNDYTYIVSKASRNTDEKIIKTNDVVESFGVFPDQIADIKALMGDFSDNVKGVKGLHYDTVLKLLKQYHDIEGIFKAIDTLPESVAQRLEFEKDKILLNKRITTIMTNLPLGRIDFKKMRLNVYKFVKFLKRQRMWAFIKLMDQDLPIYNPEYFTPERLEMLGIKKPPTQLNKENIEEVTQTNTDEITLDDSTDEVTLDDSTDEVTQTITDEIAPDDSTEEFLLKAKKI